MQTYEVTNYIEKNTKPILSHKTDFSGKACSSSSYNSEWHTLTTLNSNYLPIIVKLVSSFQMKYPQPPHRTIISLKKVERDSYTREAEQSFALFWLPNPSSANS